MGYVHKGKYITKIALYLAIIFAVQISLTGCKDSEKGSVTTGNKPGSEASRGSGQSQDDFSVYIKNALESVSKEPQKETEVVPEDKRQIVFTDKSGGNVESPVSEIINSEPTDEDILRVSASEGQEALEEMPDGLLEEDGKSDGSQTADSSSETLDSSLTPDDFQVGTSCIYINGEIDAGYGANLIAALNKVRTDLGYEPLTERVGLDKCADRRTREITSSFSHIRPNGQPFYSVAPDYFKAEMLAIDNAKPEETIDAWIRDPISRALVFNTKYTSVGAASFKCNGFYCSVIAFGY